MREINPNNLARSQTLDSLIDLVRKEEALALYLQPIINTDNQKIYGYEALSRWSYNENLIGHVPVRVRDLVALYLLFEFIHDFPEGRLFINCGLSNLEHLFPLLENRTVDNELIIELDFGMELFELKSVIRNIERINQSPGVSVAIDDIGRYDLDMRLYRHIKPAYIKVDISISRGIARALHQQLRFKELVGLADTIGATLILEGVESKRDAKFFKERNHNLIQGFYYFKPRPYTEFK